MTANNFILDKAMYHGQCLSPCGTRLQASSQYLNPYGSLAFWCVFAAISALSENPSSPYMVPGHYHG